MSALDNIGSRTTPQSEAVPGVTDAVNAAGGHGFQIDDWDRLNRFLILGTEGGTYYAEQRTHTLDNVECLDRCLASDPIRVVETVVDVSMHGRAPDNDPAIFALARACAHPDVTVKRYAFSRLDEVCRIGTHLFHFARFMQNQRGWGRAAKRGVAAWYDGKDAADLAHQVVKYRQRDGWSHRDLLRLAHPTSHPAIYDYVCGREADTGQPIIDGYLRAQASSDAAETAELVREHNLTREMVLTEHLDSPDVWRALLDVGMPMTALVRNLGVLSRHNILTPMSERETSVVARLTTPDQIIRSRIHPLAILMALAVYSSGGGFRSSNTWTPNARVVDALNDAFHLAFGNVTPANKRTLIGLDVSGSMGFNQTGAIAPLTPAQVAAAMCMITARTEPAYTVVAFADQLRSLTISPTQRLDDVLHVTRSNTFGRTDCAVPMLAALENGIEVDTFMVLTDNETWFGDIHPFQALQRYREKTGIPARLAVVGMTATDFSIANPADPGMLDVAGFDTAMPQLVSDFSAGLL